MVLTLCFLTLDFNIAIFNPIRYRYLVSKSATFIVIGVSWAFSIGASVAFVYGGRQHLDGLEIAGLLVYLIGIFTVFIAHIVLLCKIFHIQSESNALVVQIVGNRRVLEQTNRVAGTVVLVAITTLVLIIPYCVYEVFSLAELGHDDHEKCYARESKLMISELTADICLSLNCIVDPLLYVLRLSDVRVGVLRFLRRLAGKMGMTRLQSMTSTSAITNHNRAIPPTRQKSAPVLSLTSANRRNSENYNLTNYYYYDDSNRNSTTPMLPLQHSRPFPGGERGAPPRSSAAMSLLRQHSTGATDSGIVFSARL